MHGRVQHLQGETDKSAGKPFDANNKEDFEERCKKLPKTTRAKKKYKQIEVCEGGDNGLRCKITSLQSSREAWLDADIKHPSTRLLFSLCRSWFLNKCHVYRSSAFLFFNFSITCRIKHVIALIQIETSFGDSTQTNHKGVKRKKKHRQRETIGENSSVVHLADDILCSPSVISFSSVKTDRISSLPLQDDCSTDVPGDTFFFPFSPLCLSSSLWLLFSQNFMN